MANVLGRSWSRRWLALLLCALGFWLTRPAHAERVASLIAGGDPVEVPKELLPWVSWVSHGKIDGLCPKMGEQEICQWPAMLSIDVGDEGADFSFELYLETDGWAKLPGSSSHWPEAVEVDGTRAVVLSKDGAPVTRLSRGAHRLAGRFVWAKAPETLLVPNDVGLIRLSVAGRGIEFPRREDNGALWLQVGAIGGADASERAEIEVFRRIEDGVPLRVTTQLLLHVSGKTRELRLTGPMLPESRALSIESPIPARFEPHGELVLHATAGEHRVTLESLYPCPPERIALAPHVAPWPKSEVWVFVANNALRQVEVAGAPAIDVAQTNLPEEWKQHQAFFLSKEKTLTFETKRRGEPQPPPNQLKLKRQLLLDLDGQGYTVQDTLHGDLSRSFRLDLAASALGRVGQKGKDLLVTRTPEGKFGVELRQQKLDLIAEWRIDQATRDLPAVGWNSDVGSLNVTLHLPPGWDALHVSGADSSSDTWWAEWSLWSFFYVLLVTIAVARLFGLAAGGLGLATLVITHGRSEPLMAFWGILLCFLALLRLVPPSWFRRVLRMLWFATVIVFASVMVEFSIHEVRGAFFPITQPPGRGASDVIAESTEYVPSEPGPDVEQTLAAPVPAALQSKSADVAEEEVTVTAAQALSRTQAAPAAKAKRRLSLGSGSFEDDATLVDPDTVVQTGPGMPHWQWKKVALAWSGPVRADQRLQLYLVGPVPNAMLGCLRVIGAVCLALLLVRRTAYGVTPPPLQGLLRRGPVAAASLIALLLALAPHRAEAQPRSEILEELKARLARAPDCDGCLEVESLDLHVARRSFETKALVHCGRVVDYRVPGPVRSWVPANVLVDGKPATAMVLGADGFLRVRLENGSHRIEAVGPVFGNELVISPGSPAHRVQVSVEGWSVDGLRDGHVENSLHFIATERPNPKASDTDAASASTQKLPPWLEITRSIEMGVTWKVTTEVVRMSPAGDPISLRYPLLSGEEITTSNALVEQGQLVVALGRDDKRVSYQSVIKQSPELTLTAATDRPWSEEWRVRCGALWHCEFDGTAPFARVDQGSYHPRFRPWPSEKLTVKVTKPVAAPGESRTIEKVKAVLTPGHRLLKGSLSLTIKASKAYTQSVQLEPGSTVQQLTINGRDQPIRMNGSAVELPLAPGRHVIKLDWHEARPQAIVFRTPRIGLGEKAVNAKVEVELPGERWLLFTWGPSWGPKVLLWSYLLMLIAASLILVRIPYNPLRTRQWVLLGVGLTQIPIFVTLMIAGWFFLMAWRGKVMVQRAWRKKWMQIGIAVYSLVFLGCLCGAVYDGLVSNPDMAVVGSAQDGSLGLGLSWYVDRISGALPTATVISLPVVVFRLLNLLWALWLASSLLGWLKWGWTEYAKNGLWARKAAVAVPVGPIATEANPVTEPLRTNPEEPPTNLGEPPMNPVEPPRDSWDPPTNPKGTPTGAK